MPNYFLFLYSEPDAFKVTSLRLEEGTHLQVADIGSARLMIHVLHGKGAKDRYVPLRKRTLVQQVHPATLFE